MPEYLLVTDPDGTNRIVEKTKKILSFIDKQNETQGEYQRRKKGQTFENEQLATAYLIEHPRDNQYSPIPKVGILQNQNADLKNENDRLKELVAKLQAGSSQSQNAPYIPGSTSQSTVSQMNVVDTLAKIRTLESTAEIALLIKGDTRQTVIDAANAKIKSLTK